MKLAILNQLTALLPLSSLGPPLTPMLYLTISRPVDVGMSSGVSARRPMSCIFARGRGTVVEKARMEEAARGSVRKDCMFADVVRELYNVLSDLVRMAVV